MIGLHSGGLRATGVKFPTQRYATPTTLPQPAFASVVFTSAKADNSTILNLFYPCYVVERHTSLG